MTNKHFNLETIFRFATKIPKFRQKPPEEGGLLNVKVLKRFYESDYSLALEYIGKLKLSLKSKLKEVWLTKEGDITCLTVTERLRIDEEKEKNGTKNQSVRQKGTR